MKVLMTVGAGRIGSFVAAEPAGAGHDIIVLYQARPPQPVDGGYDRLGDPEDLGQLVALGSGKDAIVHLSVETTRSCFDEDAPVSF